MSSSSAERLVGLTAADVMLTTPKTLPSDVSVGAARLALDRESVQMLVLVDGSVFVGAVTQIPADADPEERAVRHANPAVETIGPEESATVAFTRAGLNPDRRIVVLDDSRHLLGLLCLDKSRTRFCGGKTV